MACEYCLQIGGNHDKRCPNYSAPESRYKCVVCNEYIQPGEEFLENDNDEKAHWECVDTGYELINFLEHSVLYSMQYFIFFLLLF